MKEYFPFLQWFKLVNRNTLQADFLAGITGAVVVLPQGVAFAMIAGMPPIYGLYTAMILPIVAALFGSSHHLISGPTTAISIVVFSTVSQFAEPGTSDFVSIAIIVTLLAGIIQLGLGLARLGSLVNFVSHTVVIGFTAGAALLIATSQLKHFLGVNVPRGAGFFSTWASIFQQIGETNLWVLLISTITLITAILIKRIHKLMPHMLVAMLIGGVLSYVVGGIERGIAVVGELPNGLPPFSIPKFDLEMAQHLAPNAFAIALLGLIEAVAIARSVATKTGQRINGNQEFIGQGLSNIIGSLFSCYAGSGSFTRSGVNHTAGAITPMAAIFAAVILMLLISFVAPLAAFLPIPAMAGIILLVAYNLIDIKHIKKIFITSRRESVVLLITLIATLTLELEYAIYLGVFFSLVFFLQETSKPRFFYQAPDIKHTDRSFFDVEEKGLPECPQFKIMRIEGSMYFGAIEHISDQFDNLLEDHVNAILFVGDGINLIDNAGAELLVNEVSKWERDGKKIYFVGIGAHVLDFLRKGGFDKEIGAENFLDTKEQAISLIYEQLDKDICADCDVRIFKECRISE
jgi:SulP family sulfate permease